MREIPEQDLLHKISLFIKSAEPFGMNPTRFGIEAIGDQMLIPTIKKGRELRRNTRARIENYMARKAAELNNVKVHGGTQ